VSAGEMRRPKRPIVIVDDDADTRDFLIALLLRAGYAVKSADNGEEALRVAKAAPPCLIVLDVMMPGLFGFRAAQLRSPEFANIPVILVSALDVAPQVARRIAPLAIVPKPIDVDALLEQVAFLCAGE
jgi:DNA-binding response OmpR family regulator